MGIRSLWPKIRGVISATGDKLAALTLLCGAVSALGAALSARFAYQAFTEAYRQANAADAQNRPWLKVTSLSPITIDRSSPLMFGSSFELEVENVGHSPALNVSVASRIQLDFFERKSDIKFQEDFCKTASINVSLLGSVVFPGEKIEVFGNNVRSAAEIASAAQINGLDLIEPQKFEIVGCVLYQTSTPGEPVHKTSFLATVYGDQALQKPGIFVWRSVALTQMFPHLESYNGSYAE